jgi:hypothetical protein
MDYDGVQSITDKFMDEGSLFGLKFREGYVFFEVTGWEQTKFDPFDQVGTVNSQSSSGFQRLDDSSGDDVLFTQKGEMTVIHAAIGMEPAFIRRYTNYPEGENRLRVLPNLGIPNSGDNYGYVDGVDSPYNQPTDAEELMIPPGTHLDFNFYNPDNRTREPTLSIVMRLYDIRVLDYNNKKDRDSINRVVASGSPMPIHPVGSTRNQERFSLQDEWGVAPISREEAKGGNNGR